MANLVIVMTYWLYRMAASIVGFSLVIERLKSSGHYDIALEIAVVRSNSMFSRDATFQYTKQCGENCLERAELAFSAEAYEHSWANASDAQLVFEWHGNYDSDLTQRADEIIRASAKEIDPYRVAEMIEKYSEVRSSYKAEYSLRRGHENGLGPRIPFYRLRVKKWGRAHITNISDRPF